MKFSEFYSLERDDAVLMGHGYVYEMIKIPWNLVEEKWYW